MEPVGEIREAVPEMKAKITFARYRTGKKAYVGIVGVLFEKGKENWRQDWNEVLGRFRRESRFDAERIALKSGLVDSVTVEWELAEKES
jgi:hypothetical protein